jgi:hypothetical protein
MKDQKVDDDDGHYIVQQDADLTDRCTSHPFAWEIDANSTRSNHQVTWPGDVWKGG